MSMRKKILLWILVLYLVAMMVYFMPAGLILTPVVVMVVPVEGLQSFVRRILPRKLKIAVMVVVILAFFAGVGMSIG